MLRLLIGHLYFRFQHLFAQPRQPAAPSVAGARYIVTTSSFHETVRIHDTANNFAWVEHCDYLAPTDDPETLYSFRCRQQREYTPEALVSQSLLDC